MRRRGVNGTATYCGKIRPEYYSWVAMKSRCYRATSKEYKYYGGRGIRVCEQWINSFAAFFSHIGPRPEGTTLERKNSDGNYEPGNVFWADWNQQANNRRNNIWVSVGGVRVTISTLAKQ